jgi:UDP-N-acetylmuramoylalanine--D-glutamate ligase
MKIAIVGFDREGRAALEYFRAQGADITVCDQNAAINVSDGIPTQLGQGYLQDLDRFDVIVRTPGLHPNKILAENPSVKEKIWSGTNEFFKVCPTKNIIGVTGTKGKGTTSTLITKMLEQAGYTVHLGGNIGLPALNMLPNIKPEDWVVLELSSFQLTDVKYSPHIALCLLVVPEHLDWHTDENEYHDAKANLFKHQSADDLAIYYANSENTKQIAQNSDGKLIPYFQAPGAEIVNGSICIDGAVICKTNELKLLGEHNWQNACAATTAVWQIDHNSDAIRSVLQSFAGLPHRIEYVREVNGIRYFNDSYATGLHATEAAIKAVPGPAIFILGGYDRMLPLEKFAAFAASAPTVREFLIIGASGDRLQKALEDAGAKNITRSTAATMQEVIADAQAIAKKDDAIVLSPGFASFDMFNNFEERGNQFRDIISNL